MGEYESPGTYHFADDIACYNPIPVTIEAP
jgi:hypothetical protein